MKIIDGSQGEGGGQILRSALALSMCTQTPIQIHNIREHLMCVQACQTICGAKVTGAALTIKSAL